MHFKNLSIIDKDNKLIIKNVFLDQENLIEKIDSVSNDIELAEYFLNKAEVAMVPGSAFGSPGCMRISFATSMKNIEIGMERIINAATK